MTKRQADTSLIDATTISSRYPHSKPLGLSDVNLASRMYLFAFTGFFSLGVLNTVGEMIGHFVPFVTSTGFSATAIYIPFILFLILRHKDREPWRLSPFPLLYLLLIAFMLHTLILHPEYAETMFDRSWGGNLYAALLSPIAPVFAFLMITMAPSASVALRGIEYSAYLAFAGNIVRFAQATIRGYWIQTNSLGSEFKAGYDLGFGYSVLMSVVVFIFLAFSGRRTILHLGGTLVGLVMIMLGGSRAPFGIALASILLFAFYFRKRLFLQSPKRLLFLLSAVLVMVILLLQFDRFLLTIQSWLDSLGVESRSIERLLEGTFAEDTARTRLQDISSELVSSGGLFGHGLFGDRHHIRATFRWGYPHNILDEFQITYGWIGGTLLMAGSIIIVIWSISISKRSNYSDLVVILAPLTFQLWVSMSYLLSPWFWALAGASWMAISRTRESRIASRQIPHP